MKPEISRLFAEALVELTKVSIAFLGDRYAVSSDHVMMKVYREQIETMKKLHERILKEFPR